MPRMASRSWARPRPARTPSRWRRDLAPDLVLMDVNLPGINGLDATRQILADNANSAVVLLLSTYEEEEYAPRAAECGAAAYIPKSVVRTRPAGSRRGPPRAAPPERQVEPACVTAGGPSRRPPRARSRSRMSSDRVEAVGHPLETRCRARVAGYRIRRPSSRDLRNEARRRSLRGAIVDARTRSRTSRRSGAPRGRQK